MRRRALEGAGVGPIGAVLLLPLASASSAVAEPADPADPAPAWQPARGVRELFLDDAGIERLEGLRRVLHAPERHPANPVLRPEAPWEDRCQVYGTACYDDALGKFRLWYLTTPRDRGLNPIRLPTHERAPHTTLAAYAESEDGVRWVKPALGQFPYDGDDRNNLLDIGKYNCEGIAVLHDPRDPDPGRRWKAAYWDHGSGDWEVRDGKPYAKPGPRDGFCVAVSPDGIRWKPYEGNPVLARYCDTNQNLLFDPRLGRYVAYSRFGMGRRLARSESADFLHWSEPKLVLECDAADGPATQIYGAGVDLYEGLYLAMVWIYREGGDGKIDTQLAASRDGVRWARVADRATWLALGDDESWEGGMARSVGRIIRRGEKLYVYYCGVHGPHGGPKFKNVVRKHRTAVGLVTLRRDGFVSLTAGEAPGRLVTRLFSLPEGDLHLNVDASKGSARVALLDAEGKPVPGLGPSAAATGDSTWAKVSWPAPVPEDLRGKSVRLEIELRSAALFAYGWGS